MNEQEQFLKDLNQKEGEDTFDFLKQDNPEQEVEVKEKDEDNEMKLRNRREKRLAEKLQAERESSIRLAERVAILTEAQKFKEEAGDDHLKAIEKIYGTDTPEAIAATEILKSALKSVGESATERALAQFREEQKQAREALKKEEDALDSMIEDIEEESGSILTETQKKGFFTLLERMSPKDNDGNVIHYADHRAVWDTYQARTAKTENRAKDLSSRSMVQSGASKESQLEDDAALRFLKDNGII